MQGIVCRTRGVGKYKESLACIQMVEIQGMENARSIIGMENTYDYADELRKRSSQLIIYLL